MFIRDGIDYPWSIHSPVTITDGQERGSEAESEGEGNKEEEKEVDSVAADNHRSSSRGECCVMTREREASTERAALRGQH